jgi:hypothetical protein
MLAAARFGRGWPVTKTLKARQAAAAAALRMRLSVGDDDRFQRRWVDLHDTLAVSLTPAALARRCARPAAGRSRQRRTSTSTSCSRHAAR